MNDINKWNINVRCNGVDTSVI